LRSVAKGAHGESLRLYVPENALLFSSLDARRPGYPRAVELAREAGFTPVIRLAGGHAAVFLESSLAFAWATAETDAHLRIKPRFDRWTRLLVRALRELGLDARVGEVPGEYCPGEYSVNIAGHTKVMGVGQRVIRGGAHVGGVLTIGQTPALRDVLIPIYEALELDFRPETAGGLADFDASLTHEDVVTAIVAVLREDGHEVREATFPQSITQAARPLLPLHSAERREHAGAALRPSLDAAGAKVLVQDGSARPAEGSDPTEES
jgi:lipoate-protein ligase A